MVETLLSDRLCRERTVWIGGDYLLDSPFGIHVVKLGSIDSSDLRGEAHRGQLLKVLAESGVSSTATVESKSGQKGSVVDLLQDATLRFTLSDELEFVSDALALWLPPATTWSDRFGETHDFDQIMIKLLECHLGEGACGGCHLPYSIAILLRVDEQYKILDNSNRRAALDWLKNLSGILEREQSPERGGWDRDWGGSIPKKRLYGDDVMDRITIIGHHLEWIAIVPQEVRPSRSTVDSAVSDLVGMILKLPHIQSRSFKSILPCSHAARALCLLRGQDPFTIWNTYRDEGHLIPSARMAYEYRARGGTKP
jgi:hypothetical protein